MNSYFISFFIFMLESILVILTFSFILFFIVYVIFPDLYLTKSQRELYFVISESEFEEVEHYEDVPVKLYISKNNEIKILYVTKDAGQILSKQIIVFSNQWKRIYTFMFHSQIMRLSRKFKNVEKSKIQLSNFLNKYSELHLLFEWFKISYNEKKELVE